jgi:hypothetical protein
MAESIAFTKVVGEISAVVYRCGCGDPDSHSKLDPPQPCPSPRAVEDLGVIATSEEDL